MITLTKILIYLYYVDRTAQGYITTPSKKYEQYLLILMYLLHTTEATEAHFFAQESSSTLRIWVRFELSFCRDELRFCESNSVSAEKSEPPWLPYSHQC